MLAGEMEPSPAESGVQPGGRPPAPGRLALVQAFMNSYYDLDRDHGAELLHSPAALGEWLANRGLLQTTATVTPKDHRRALAVREALRDLASANSAGPGGRANALGRLNELSEGAAVEVRFVGSGPRFVRARSSGVGGALGTLLAIAATAMLGDAWSRLKICPGHDCGWAFYDNSHNRSGRWCSMAVCGARAKARAHYHRQRSSGCG